MQDGTLHCHVKNISRRGRDGRTRSVVAKAAYNSGQNLWFDREARHTTLAERQDIFHTEIMAQPDVPAWVRSREQLWNQVETSVKRKDGRLAKEIVVAITRGIPPDQWRVLAADFAAPYVAAGHIADLAIHEDGSLHNPHLHVLLTVHDLKPKGFGAKLADVDNKRFVKDARTGWETLTNKYLKANGLSVRVNARSFKAQGLDRIPTKHRGPDPAERQARYRAQETSQPFHHQQELPMTKRQDYEDGKPVVRQQEEEPWFDRAVAGTRTSELLLDQAANMRERYDLERGNGHLTPRIEMTPDERQLQDAVAGAPENLRSLVEAEMMHQRVSAKAAQIQEQRLEVLHQRLEPAQREALERYMLKQQDQQRVYPQPEPGPHGDPYLPSELDRARAKMQKDYEREDEPQR